MSDCPQSFVAGPNNGIAFRSHDPMNGGTWPLTQGDEIEFWIPVRSSTTLTGTLFNARVEATDGNSTNPVLSPNAPVWVAQAPAPNIQYPNPSTTHIKSTEARSLAWLENHYVAGNVYWDIGTTTSYTYSSSPFVILDTYDSISLYSDWKGLTPGTVYHWRLRFVTASGTTYIGSDRTFTTLPRELRPISSWHNICRFFNVCD